MRKMIHGVRQAAIAVGAGALVGLLACTSAQTPAFTPAPSPKLLLPDLKAEPPIEMYIRPNAAGERELWFSTAVSNIGDGPLEMIGIPDKYLKETRAVQRVMTEQGTFEERVAGHFIFHEAHDHWHFEDFAELEIFSVDSAGSPARLMATTGKTTFCMRDTARLPSPPPNTPEKAVYGECDPVIQGISVGWVDIYDSRTPGQQLNIENLPDGRYMVRTTVNPGGLILEKDKNNNSSIVYVEIRGTAISVTGSAAAS